MFEEELFEEALGGTSGCVEGEEKESPDIDAFEYMPQGMRLSYSLRTARTRVESLSTSSHRHGQGLRPARLRPARLHPARLRPARLRPAHRSLPTTGRTSRTGPRCM